MRFKTEGLGGGGYDLSGLFLYALMILGIVLFLIVLGAKGIVNAMKTDRISAASGIFLFIMLIIAPVVIFMSIL